MSEFNENICKAYATLNLERKIVGVKFIKSYEEYANYDAAELSRPMSYCVAVKSATLGHSIKMNKETSGCGGSTRALGFEKPTYEYFNGNEGYNGLRLYKDRAVAMSCAGQTAHIFTSTYGVLVQPIEKYGDGVYPDVVIIIGNPREMMRVIQGYTYHYGITRNISLSGNQAICAESTVYPLINNTINVSFLCSGTRYLANWSENEVSVGMPYSIFLNVIDGVYNTINAVEMDARKQEINEVLIKAGLSGLDMDGIPYYIEEEIEKREKMKNGK